MLPDELIDSSLYAMLVLYWLKMALVPMFTFTFRKSFRKNQRKEHLRPNDPKKSEQIVQCYPRQVLALV